MPLWAPPPPFPPPTQVGIRSQPLISPAVLRERLQQGTAGGGNKCGAAPAGEAAAAAAAAAEEKQAGPARPAGERQQE